jgi:hypothetical protein
MARRCVFCKGEGVTREHVFAKWVREALPGGGLFSHRHSDGTTWESEIPDLKANRTCAPCNNRWIERLDAAAKSLLTLPVRGEPQTIGRGSPQTVVSAWCFKTALLLELCAKSRASFIKPRDYRAFYHLRHPPEAVYIWLTAYGQGPNETEFQAGWVRPWSARFSLLDGSEREGYAITFNVGHLAVQIVGHDPPDDLNIRQAGELPTTTNSSDYLLPLWPPTGEAIHWPPKFGFDAGGLDALSNVTPSR